MADLANLVYDGLQDYKTSNPDFFTIDLGTKVIVAEAINDVLNPKPTQELEDHSIDTVFPDLFTTYSDPFSNASELAILANSKVNQVRDSGYDLNTKVSLYGGLSILSASASYWNLVRTTPGDLWYVFIESESGVGSVPTVVSKALIKTDAKGFLTGFLGKTATNGLEGKWDPLSALGYGVATAAAYSLTELIWNIFEKDVSE